MSVSEDLSLQSTFEKALVQAAKEGREYSAPGEEHPQSGMLRARTSIRSAIIRALCVGDSGWKTHEKGLSVRGVTIVGPLDLSGVSIGISLSFSDCTFLEKPVFAGTRLGGLSFAGCTVPGLDAERISCLGHLRVDQQSVATAPVVITGASVGGLVSLGGEFDGAGSVAVNGRGLECRNGLFLRDGFLARGEIDLSRAKLGIALVCGAGQVVNPDGIALNARGVECRGNVNLINGFAARGQVSFARARIAGQFNCSGAELDCAWDYALNLEGTVCEEDIFLEDGFRAIGGVSMAGLSASGQISCIGASMTARGGDESFRALNAQGLECRGDMFIGSGFTAGGEVNIAGATISGQLSCADGIFCGQVVLDGASVGGEFFWRKVASAARVQMSLTRTKVGTLAIDEQSIPGSLGTKGLTYEGLDPLADLGLQKKWLERADYDPQPYQELARLLRQHGYRDGATAILLAGERRRFTEPGVSVPRRIGGWIFSAAAGYGYRPSRALIWLLVLMATGTVLFGISGGRQLMIPVPGKSLATAADFGWLDAIVFSLDSLIPVVNLGVRDSWTPARSSVLLWIYLRAHVAFGWFFSTLAVLGFTGVVRRKD